MIRRLLLPLVAVVLALTTIPAALAGPGDSYTRPSFGDGTLPAGCILSRDPVNPDNQCYHMKVGLNALDSPKVDVDVLVPISPAVERDMRIATQAVQMWDDGLIYLAEQMRLDWLAKGLDVKIRTHVVPVNDSGLPEDPIGLIDPEIVVIMSNPAGGIGIGIDPVSFAGELGIVDGEGTPCADFANPFSMDQWAAREGFEQHNDEPGGIYVEDCGGVGGNVCFAVNGAVDPVPGLSDFFPLYELVAHEFGHCLTVGHVGDGADGPWGMTATNDIMAYSTDPPLVNKCVSTLDVEGFALRMSKYLDVNGDGTVNAKDELIPNDLAGDGLSSFQVQNPANHSYASATGLPGDCPQPDVSLVPGAEGNFFPTAVTTTKPKLNLGKVAMKNGKLVVKGAAEHVSKVPAPTSFTGSATDESGDSYSPITDIENVSVKVSKSTITASFTVGQLYPLIGASPVAYSLNIDGRRLDSFIPNGNTTGTPVVMDNGTGYYLPEGTATWDLDTNTVSFTVNRHYLADQQITAPYNVYAVTGYHARSNDWVATDDLAPTARDLNVAGPDLGKDSRDLPKASTVVSKTYQAAEGSFLPNDTTLGVGLVSAIDTRDYGTIPLDLQSTVEVTLEWQGLAFLDLIVGGGSSAEVIEETDNSLTVRVPWARRNLSFTVDPTEVFEPTDYTVTVTRSTVVADKDRDGVPNVADLCPTDKGPSTGAGCPDTDADGIFDKYDACPKAAGLGADGCPVGGGERVVIYVDGTKVASQYLLTKHGADAFAMSSKLAGAAGGKHKVVIKWFDQGKLVKKVSETVR
jgi:hypothetical protein